MQNEVNNTPISTPWCRNDKLASYTGEPRVGAIMGGPQFKEVVCLITNEVNADKIVTLANGAEHSALMLEALQAVMDMPMGDDPASRARRQGIFDQVDAILNIVRKEVGSNA